MLAKIFLWNFRVISSNNEYQQTLAAVILQINHLRRILKVPYNLLKSGTTDQNEFEKK